MTLGLSENGQMSACQIYIGALQRKELLTELTMVWGLVGNGTDVVLERFSEEATSTPDEAGGGWVKG